MKIILLSIALLGLTAAGFTQRQFEYKATLSGLVASEKSLPMWATTNKHGIVPDSRGGLLQAGIYSDFNVKKKIQVAYGFSGAGFLTQDKNKVVIDELYFSLKWQKIRLDLGMIHPEEKFNGVSAQNGSFVLSANTRTMPGYNLHTDYISVPLTNHVLAFRFNLSDYTLIDKRFVDRTRLHHKSLFVRLTPWHRLELIAGLEHWAQWAGDSPMYGKQPDSFRDYLKVFTGRSGGVGATQSDSINALGNHLGSRYFRINYKATNYTISAYFDNFFEDNKIDNMANLPDGAYGLYFGSKNKRQWVSDVMYEFVYSKYQSGPYHDREATEKEKAQQDPHDPYYGRKILGGNDNDFNNGEYQSGWTYYGRTIGTPFITPQAPDTDGITLGVYNNRVIAHYIGLKGYFMSKVPYKLRFSYSLNYGTYGVPLESTPKQFSFGLEAGILRNPRIPFQIDLGVYGDYGKLYSKNFGFSISFSRNGVIR